MIRHAARVPIFLLMFLCMAWFGAPPALADGGCTCQAHFAKNDAAKTGRYYFLSQAFAVNDGHQCSVQYMRFVHHVQARYSMWWQGFSQCRFGRTMDEAIDMVNVLYRDAKNYHGYTDAYVVDFR